jgi:hypothetical protein
VRYILANFGDGRGGILLAPSENNLKLEA